MPPEQTETQEASIAPDGTIRVVVHHVHPPAPAAPPLPDLVLVRILHGVRCSVRDRERNFRAGEIVEIESHDVAGLLGSGAIEVLKVIEGPSPSAEDASGATIATPDGSQAVPAEKSRPAGAGGSS
jgi:hypothetical protein